MLCEDLISQFSLEST